MMGCPVSPSASCKEDSRSCTDNRHCAVFSIYLFIYCTDCFVWREKYRRWGADEASAWITCWWLLVDGWSKKGVSDTYLNIVILYRKNNCMYSNVYFE
jgi:hypothetical protein